MQTRQSPVGVQVPWVCSGNSLDKKADKIIYKTVAKPGDYEIVAFGASTAGGERDKPQEGNRLAGEGFQLIGAKGSEDKKIELWIRKNAGQESIKLCGPCGVWTETGKRKGGMGCGWGVITIDGKNELDLADIRKAEWKGSHSETMTLKKASSRIGLNILAVLYDDSVETTEAKNGDIALGKWGFGDGDGISLVVWQPGQEVPSSVSVKKHDRKGGKQLAAMTVNLRLAGTPNTPPEEPPSDGGDGGEGRRRRRRRRQ